MYELDKKNMSLLRERREKEIRTRIPEFNLLLKQYNSTNTQILKILMGNDIDKNERIKSLNKDLLSITNKRCELLVHYGYSETFLDNLYLCNKCEDTGYILNEKCSCFEQRLINKYCDLSNIREVLDKENFSTYTDKYYSNELIPHIGLTHKTYMNKIYNKIKSFTVNFKNDNSNLLLTGATGLGKTFFCNCIAYDLLEKGYTVVYLTAPKYFSLIEDYRFNRNKTEKLLNYLEFVKNADLFILDDLGVEFQTTLTTAEVFRVINDRLIENNSTIISTNLSLNDLGEKYNERISSRLMGHYTDINFIGKDIRALKTML